jgi:hypothetical protein
VIKETCSCGAQIEISLNQGSMEQTTISEWRREHKHEPVARDVPKLSDEEIMKAMGWSSIPTLFVKGPNWYEENHHWVWGEDSRVWIHASMAQPDDFADWDKRYPKRMDVRPAMYDSPA